MRSRQHGDYSVVAASEFRRRHCTASYAKRRPLAKCELTVVRIENAARFIKIV